MVEFFNNIYLVPEGREIIKDNELFFDKYTKPLLNHDVDKLLSHTDKCKYLDKYMFIDQFGYSISWSDLSTGGKMVLNGYYHPDKVFNGIEASYNAMTDMALLPHGAFYDAVPWTNEDGDYAIDAMVDDEHFTSIKEYMNAD